MLNRASPSLSSLISCTSAESKISQEAKDALYQPDRLAKTGDAGENEDPFLEEISYTPSSSLVSDASSPRGENLYASLDHQTGNRKDKTSHKPVSFVEQADFPGESNFTPHKISCKRSRVNEDIGISSKPTKRVKCGNSYISADVRKQAATAHSDLAPRKKACTLSSKDRSAASDSAVTRRSVKSVPGGDQKTIEASTKGHVTAGFGCEKAYGRSHKNQVTRFESLDRVSTKKRTLDESEAGLGEQPAKRIRIGNEKAIDITKGRQVPSNIQLNKTIISRSSGPKPLTTEAQRIEKRKNKKKIKEKKQTESNNTQAKGKQSPTKYELF